MKYVYGFAAALFILCSVLAFLVWKDKKSQAYFGQRLEKQVFELLETNRGECFSITGRKEISHEGAWAEIVREVRVKNRFCLEELENGLKRIIRKTGAEEYAGTAGSSRVEFGIGKFDRVFERIVFLLPEESGIVIVIDDVGYHPKKVDEFLNIGIPLTFSIMPRGKYSRKIAEKLNKLNFRYLLHLSLEPVDAAEIGSDGTMLMTGMDDGEIISRFNNYFDSLLTKSADGASNPVGVNNHMGSKFTADYEKMKVLLPCIKARNVFFLDSATSQVSVAKKVSDEIGLKCLKNSVFLDSVRDEEAIEKEFGVLMSIARKRGWAVGIGHIYNTETVNVLERMKTEMKKENCRFVPIEEIVK